MNKRTYVGLDVRARSVKGCSIDHDTGEILRQNIEFHMQSEPLFTPALR